MLKIKKRQDIIIGHNMILKSFRKDDFIHKPSYINEEFVKVDDMVQEIDDVTLKINAKMHNTKTKVLELHEFNENA